MSCLFPHVATLRMTLFVHLPTMCSARHGPANTYFIYPPSSMSLMTRVPIISLCIRYYHVHAIKAIFLDCGWSEMYRTSTQDLLLLWTPSDNVKGPYWLRPHGLCVVQGRVCGRGRANIVVAKSRYEDIREQ